MVLVACRAQLDQGTRKKKTVRLRLRKNPCFVDLPYLLVGRHHLRSWRLAPGLVNKPKVTPGSFAQNSQGTGQYALISVQTTQHGRHSTSGHLGCHCLGTAHHSILDHQPVESQVGDRHRHSAIGAKAQSQECSRGCGLDRGPR